MRKSNRIFRTGGAVALFSAGCLLTTQAVAKSLNDIIHLEQAMPGLETFDASVDRKSGVFLFDSGFGVSAVTPKMAAALGCSPWGKIAGFRATGERLDEQRCDGATLAVGPVAHHIAELGVFDFAKFMGALGEKVSGAFGLDVFDGHVVTLSVARHEIIVEDAQAAKEIALHGIAVPIRLVRAAEGAALTVDIGVKSAKGTLWMEVDTGNGGPSMVDRLAAPLLGLDASKESPQTLDAVVEPNVHLSGPVVVKDMIMDGNIGRDALKDWDVTLDLANGRAWLSPAE